MRPSGFPARVSEFRERPCARGAAIIPCETWGDARALRRARAEFRRDLLRFPIDFNTECPNNKRRNKARSQPCEI
eukprot:9044560-Pyramimonas_sp.AAC.1